MKQKIQMALICALIGILFPCVAEVAAEEVVFVLKIDAGRVINDPQELVELVEAYGAQEDSVQYRALVDEANLRESPFSLTVHVEASDSDAAHSVDFAKALAQYMDQTLETYHAQTCERLSRRRDMLTHQKLETQAHLKSLRGKVSGAPEASPGLKAQLDTRIDLSEFKPELPVGEAFEILRESVDPPLSIVPLWKDLLDNAEIEPVTPIDMDGILAASVGTALNVLLKALGGGYYEVMYEIQDSVIMIGTPETLGVGRSDTLLDLATAEYTSTSDINQQRRELVHQIDALEMDISRQQSIKSAVTREISQIQARIDKALAGDPVLKDFESLVTVMQKNLEAIRDKNPDEYVTAMERTVSLRMKVAEHKARLVSQTGGSDLAKIREEIVFSGSKLAGDLAELNALKKQLMRVEEELAKSVRLRSTVNELQTLEESLREIDEMLMRTQTLIVGLEEPSVTCVGL